MRVVMRGGKEAGSEKRVDDDNENDMVSSEKEGWVVVLKREYAQAVVRGGLFNMKWGRLAAMSGGERRCK